MTVATQLERTAHSFSFGLALLVPFALGASAAEFPLSVELREGRTAEFGTVFVEEDLDGSLRFEVQIDPAVVGTRADIHQLYFNLVEPVDGLMLETEDEVPRPYALRESARLRSGKAAHFDWRVDLGHSRADESKHHGRDHSNRWGNGILQSAHFRLMADRPLSIEDLMPISMTRSGVVLQMAVYLKHAAFQSRPIGTIGGVYDPASEQPAPEPDPEPMPEPEPDPVPAPRDCSWTIDPATGMMVLTCN